MKIEDYINQADHFLFEENYNAALVPLKEALELCKQQLAEASNNANSDDDENVMNARLQLADVAERCSRAANEPELRVDALEYAKLAAENAPSNSNFQLTLARLYFDFRLYEKAIPCYWEFLNSSNGQSADVYNELGNSYYALRDFSPAISAYKKAIDLVNDSATLFKNLANAYAHNGETSLAIDCYCEAIQLKPSSVSMLFERADLFLKIGEREAATHDWMSILEIDSSNYHQIQKKLNECFGPKRRRGNDDDDNSENEDNPEIKRLKADNDELREQVTRVIAKKNAKERRLNDQISELEHNAASSQAEITELQHNAANSQAEITELREKVASLTSINNEQTPTLLAENSSLVDALTADITHLNLEIFKLESERAKLRAQVKILLDEMSHLKEKNATLQSQNGVSSIRNSKLEIELNTLQDKFNRQNTETEKLQTQVASLTVEKESLNGKWVNLATSFARLESGLADTRRSVEQSQNTMTAANENQLSKLDTIDRRVQEIANNRSEPSYLQQRMMRYDHTFFPLAAVSTDEDATATSSTAPVRASKRLRTPSSRNSD